MFNHYEEMRRIAKLARELTAPSNLGVMIEQTDATQGYVQRGIEDFYRLTLPTAQMIEEMNARKEMLVSSIDIDAIESLATKHRDLRRDATHELFDSIERIRQDQQEFLSSTQQLAEALMQGRHAISDEMVRDWTAATSEVFNDEEEVAPQTTELEDSEREIRSFEWVPTVGQARVIVIVAMVVYMVASDLSSLTPDEREAAEKTALLIISIFGQRIFPDRF